MRDVAAELKDLRLLGMAGAWGELMAQGEDGVASSRWLIEHLLRAENTDRAMRSVSHQMAAAKFPVHWDLVGFDFDSSKVDQGLVRQLASNCLARPRLFILGTPVRKQFTSSDIPLPRRGAAWPTYRTESAPSMRQGFP